MTHVITINSNNIPVPEQIEEKIKSLGIDLKIWELSAFKVIDGKWTVLSKKRDQNLTWVDGVMDGHAVRENEWLEGENKIYKVELSFRRRIQVIDFTTIREAVKSMPQQISYKRPKRTVEGDICLELAVLDAHIGKLAWIHETNYRNYDIPISLQDYKYANDKLLEWAAGNKPTRIEYVLGQDLLHVDNMVSHTTGGDHTLDVDGRLTKISAMALEVIIRNIYEALKVAPVTVRWVPGNHDFYASFALAMAIKEHFRENPYVTVDLEKSSRKAILWGNLLIGWTHRIVGKHNVWANELAQQFPELWGKSKFREWHHGDQHKKQDVKITPTFTSGGVICRQLTALSPVDKWHFENVFTDAVPGGEGFLWSKDMGVFANYIAWTGQYEDHRNKLVIGQTK